MCEGLRAGAVLAGKYRIERLIGCGGMGVVVAATHLHLHAPRAIKLRQAFEGEPEVSAERFLREAAIASRLTSEHVVRMHDGGTLPDGAPYIVMERLEGVDLGDLVQRGGPLPPEDAALYVLQVCAAMEEAHALGIIHLDLKPANLFLTVRADGSPCVKVLDFGIARCKGEGVTPSPERVEGSPAYMAPEQARSDAAIGPQADVWALGVVLYELVTGRAPFRANTLAATFAHVLHREPAPATALRPDLPPGLSAVISRCLDKSPERRFADAGELHAALAPFAVAAGPAWLPDAVGSEHGERAGPLPTVRLGRAARREDARAFEPTMTLDDEACWTARAEVVGVGHFGLPEEAVEETGSGRSSRRPSPLATSVGEGPAGRVAWAGRRQPMAIP